MLSLIPWPFQASPSWSTSWTGKTWPPARTRRFPITPSSQSSLRSNVFHYLHRRQVLQILPRSPQLRGSLIEGLLTDGSDAKAQDNELLRSNAEEQVLLLPAARCRWRCWGAAFRQLRAQREPKGVSNVDVQEEAVRLIQGIYCCKRGDLQVWSGLYRLSAYLGLQELPRLGLQALADSLLLQGGRRVDHFWTKDLQEKRASRTAQGPARVTEYEGRGGRLEELLLAMVVQVQLEDGSQYQAIRGGGS